MKLGLNSMVFCDCYSDDYFPWVKIAAELGYELLEVVVGDRAIDSKALKHRLQQHGLGCALSCGMSQQTNLAAADPAVRAAGQAFVAHCCALAAELGSSTLSGPLFINGAPPLPRSNEQRQREWERVAQSLATAAHTASHYGVTLCIEPLNRYKTDLINTVVQARQMIAQTGCSNIKILYDSYHANIEESCFVASIAAAGSLLGEVHLCDNNKGVPGSGHIPFSAILAALRAERYTGPLIFESFLPNGKDNIWQPLASDAQALAETAAGALRQLVDGAG